MSFRRLAIIFCAIISCLIVLYPAVSGADPLDNWSWRNPLPQGNHLNGVAYGNSTYVAVGILGTIISSGDGDTWTKRDSGTTEDLYGVAYGNGIFVAVSLHGAVLTSSNGTDWTTRVTGTSTVYLSKPNLVYGNNIFLFQGYQVVMTSADGITWTSNAFYGNLFSDITYCNNMFVGVGATESFNAVVQVSTDGATWTYKSPSSGYGIAAVTCDNNNIFAIVYNGTIFKSPDATTWTTVDNTGNNLNGVAYGNGVYVALGPDGTIVKSTDGSTWSSVSSGTTQPLAKVIYANSVFVAAGYYGTLLKSLDGTTWTAINPGLAQTFSDVAYGNGIFVAAGSANNPNVGPNTDTLRISKDGGLTWTPKEAGTFYGLAFAHGKFIAVGHAGMIKVSTDGDSWASQSISSMPSLYDAAYGNGTFVIVGGNNQGAVYTSPDGVTWTQQTISDSGNLSLYGFYAVSYGKNTFVAVGNGWNDTTWSGVVFTSQDGKTWTLKESGNHNAFQDVAYGNGSFVAVGGGIFTSADGATWTKVSDEAGNSVSYGNGIFMVASEGELFTSENGTTWTSRDPKIKYSLRGVSYGGGTFIAAGEGNTILQSDPMTVTKYDLTVNISGSGSGTVVLDPAGTSCASGCTASVESKSTVILTAEPSATSSFTGWGGDCSGQTECEITVDAAKTVTATFSPKNTTQYTLTVTSSTTGTITGTGIDCGGTGHTECSEQIYSGDSITLTAAPESGYKFTGWTDATCKPSGTGTCTVTMTANKTVTAKFAALKKYTLKVIKTKTGTVAGTDETGGTVINCGVSGTDCSDLNYEGTAKVVNLTATPKTGYKFIGWSDKSCTGTGTCTVTLSTNKTITPKFAALKKYTLKVKVQTGGSVIDHNESGAVVINCGGTNKDCSETYYENTTNSILLLASPLDSSKYEFIGWTIVGTPADSCTGTTTGCTVTVQNAKKTVTAKFRRK